MANVVRNEVVMQSKNGEHRYTLYVTDDGKLAARREILAGNGKKWIEAERHLGGKRAYVSLTWS